jgi:hypothetical protein
MQYKRVVPSRHVIESHLPTENTMSVCVGQLTMLSITSPGQPTGSGLQHWTILKGGGFTYND